MALLHWKKKINALLQSGEGLALLINSKIEIAYTNRGDRGCRRSEARFLRVERVPAFESQPLFPFLLRLCRRRPEKYKLQGSRSIFYTLLNLIERQRMGYIGTRVKKC